MSRGPLGMPTWIGSKIRRRTLMAIWGADVQQLRDLGNKLQQGASEIETQKSNLNKVLHSTDWKGPDADKFRSEWDGNHMTQLSKVAEALKEAGQKAGRNADEQDNASR
jgi:hypothetical protein